MNQSISAWDVERWKYATVSTNTTANDNDQFIQYQDIWKIQAAGAIQEEVDKELADEFMKRIRPVVTDLTWKKVLKIPDDMTPVLAVDIAKQLKYDYVCMGHAVYEIIDQNKLEYTELLDTDIIEIIE